MSVEDEEDRLQLELERSLDDFDFQRAEQIRDELSDVRRSLVEDSEPDD